MIRIGIVGVWFMGMNATRFPRQFEKPCKTSHFMHLSRHFFSL
jgi:hypothetical protein